MKQKKYGMVIDLKRCLDCKACSVACKAENRVPLGIKRTQVESKETGKYPDVTVNSSKLACMHCDNAPCVNVCPTGASYKRKDGIVALKANRCIGCKYCVVACPYQARSMNPKTEVVEKCDLCDHRVDKGIEPSCVNTCIGKAITFGNLKDPSSKIAKEIGKGAKALHSEFGTKPSILYLAYRR